MGARASSEILVLGDSVRRILSVGRKAREIPIATVIRSVASDATLPDVPHLPESASLAHAAALMSLRGITELVVTDVAGCVRGLLSAADIHAWVAAQVGAALAIRSASTVPLESSAWEFSPGADSPSAKSSEGAHHEAQAESSVLVVEDDSVIAAQLVEILEDEGYRVRRASDGLDALVTLRAMEEMPGLILLDLVMPRMDGWAFRRVQLRDTFLAAIPTIVMTAFSHAADTPELGAVPVLSKPLRLERVLAAVAQHCRPDPPPRN